MDAQPCLVLAPREGAIPLGGSRLFGTPDVSEGFTWPTWQFTKDHSLSGADGEERLRFIAQINLAELPGGRLGGFSGGHLLFFYDDENCLSLYPDQDRPGHRVLYVPADRPLVRLDGPSGTGVRIVKTTVSVAEDGELRFEPADGLPVTPRHWIGGIPTVVQGDPCEEAQHLLGEPEQRALLLQVDTDPTLNVMWGDTGAIYFTIPRSDLADGTLDRTWLTYQSA